MVKYKNFKVKHFLFGDCLTSFGQSLFLLNFRHKETIYIYKIRVIKKSIMKEIEINGKNYKLKYTIRSLFIWEQITGKSFKIENMLDNYIFFYSMILANNPDEILDWDTFLDALDADPTLFKKMSDIIEEQQKKDNLFTNEEKSKKGSKKK